MKRTTLVSIPLLGVATSLLFATACKGYRVQEFKEPQKLGGKDVSAEVLTAGREAYTQYCRACHGDAGDGKGPAARGLRPPPRDFTVGTFKFAAVPGGSLPHDEDLERIIRDGLHGTAMLAWDGVPQHKVHEIIQYVKTFSPRWKEEEPGERVVPEPDPWKGREAEAVVRGRKVYHGLAQCLSCHPAYASKQQITAMAKELAGPDAAPEFREDMYGAALTDSEFGVKLLPPDFLRSELRSVRPETRKADLYRVIASGVGGTAMPTWKGSLPDEEIWALVHFVDSLVAARGTPAARAMRHANEAADASWKPPPPPQ
jgi:mono/diheme cytochrome c family protein